MSESRPRRPTLRSGVRRETSAGGIVIRRTGGQAFILLIRDGHRNWGFPKGHIERGEAPAAAAIREVREETGIRRLTLLGPLRAITWTFRARGVRIRKTCHYFALETDQVRTRPQRDEGISACRWVTPDVGARLLTHDTARQLLAGARSHWEGAVSGRQDAPATTVTGHVQHVAQGGGS